MTLNPSDYPIPLDAGQPARAYLTTSGRTPSGETLWSVYFGRDGGRRMEPVGPADLPWRRAVAFCRALNRWSGLDR
jgi:hypothetical protein